MFAIELENATVCSIGYANKKCFGIWTKGDPCNLTKEIYLLSTFKILLDIHNVNEVSWLSHGKESTIHSKSKGPYCSYSTIQNCK